MTLPPTTDAAPAPVPDEVRDLRVSLRHLDRRDWGLWFTAITILLLLCFAIFSLAAPAIARYDEWLTREQITIGVRGLLALVLLFSVFAIYQQYLIKRFRSKLQEQIAVVSALHSRAETFERLAILDPLTGLFNRRFAYEHLPREIARAERTGHPLNVMMIDLDDFKSINDAYGHGVGDEALTAFARHLKNAVRSIDLPVRLGGDEFMVALPDCSAEQLSGPLSRIHGCSLEHKGKRIEVKFSVGVAEHHTGETIVQLLERADASMYANKHQGEKKPGSVDAI